VAKGIRAAVEQRARIINLSLSVASDEEKVAMAMDFANKAGRLQVVAAGNFNCNVGMAPASFGDARTFEHWYGNGNYNTFQIVVGATDQNDNRAVWNKGNKCVKDNGSNYGNWVNVYAPGNSIETTGYNGSYTSKKGTSFAAPFVASVANLVWAAKPGLTNTGIRDTILAAADGVNTTDADANPLAIQRLNAFTAVLQAAAQMCDPAAGQCPNAPVVSVSKKACDGVSNCPLVVMGTDGANENDTQPASFHGISVSMDRPQRFAGTKWQVNVAYDLKTWDAYQPQTNPPNAGLGYWDVFTMTLSPMKYWELQKIQSPLEAPGNFNNNPGLEIEFLFGGKLRGDGQRDDLAGSQNVSFPWTVVPQQYPYLSLMLDTARPPQTDNKYPSFGSYTIVDLTPQ
jgi:hypothetical protein